MRRAERRRRRGGQTGVRLRRTEHPVAASIEASPCRARASRSARQLLLSFRTTPPLRGGEFTRPISRCLQGLLPQRPHYRSWLAKIPYQRYFPGHARRTMIPDE